MSIEKVTLENAAEQLKSKIRTAFVELLPEEQWKEMVSTELKRFMAQSMKSDGYNRSIEMPSAFSQICSEVFTEYLKVQIKNLLASTEWGVNWNGKPQISEAISAWLTANSKALIESTVQAMAGSAAQQLIQNMRHL